MQRRISTAFSGEKAKECSIVKTRAHKNCRWESAVDSCLIIEDILVCHSAAKRRNLLLVRLDYTARVPFHEYEFFVYILSSRSRTLYIGVTRNLRVRVLQHRENKPGSFTARYNIDRLVYFERFQYIGNAIAREKELKDWNRARKIGLIESLNPTWQDLAADL
jgi:putative endonuclease